MSKKKKVKHSLLRMTLFIYKNWKKWHVGQPVQNLYIISVAVSLYTRERNRIVNTLCHACNSSQHSKGCGVEMFGLAVAGDAQAAHYSTALWKLNLIGLVREEPMT